MPDTKHTGDAKLAAEYLTLILLDKEHPGEEGIKLLREDQLTRQELREEAIRIVSELHSAGFKITLPLRKVDRIKHQLMQAYTIPQTLTFDPFAEHAAAPA